MQELFHILSDLNLKSSSNNFRINQKNNEKRIGIINPGYPAFGFFYCKNMMSILSLYYKLRLNWSLNNNLLTRIASQ
jgi:hypothetical protein